jgi:ubiquinone/menaquinone biosynthesis C-methylase UbiE
MNSDPDRELFFSLLSPGPGEKILDVGAGKGVVAGRVLTTSKGEVYAIDPDEARVASMRRDHPELKSSVAGSESMTFPDTFFDKAYTTMAVHHFADLDKALKELARVLKEGGTLLILDVDPRYGRGRLLKFIENTVMRRGARFMEEGEMVKSLEAAGRFKVVSSTRGKTGYFILCVRS